MLQAMRGAGAEITLRKGDWLKTAEKQIEVYTPDELQKFLPLVPSMSGCSSRRSCSLDSVQKRSRH
jgi:hypothetical protein